MTESRRIQVVIHGNANGLAHAFANTHDRILELIATIEMMRRMRAHFSMLDDAE